MRKWLIDPIVALATLLACSPVMLAQADRSGAAKTDTMAQPSDPHDFSGVWDTAPYMQPKGEVNPLDLSGHPTTLPPFTPWGKAKYDANVKFIAARGVLDCDAFGTARHYFTPRPFEMIPARDGLVQLSVALGTHRGN